MKFVAILFAAGVLVLSQASGLAWGSAGHAVIAAEAYRQLSPEMKAAVIDVLKAHPEFSKWAGDYRPNPAYDQATFIVMRCSAWPDEIRRHGNPYDHPNWHFIDYPLRPPAFAFEADERPSDDILYGMTQCHKILSDSKAPAEERAVYLSWLIHLVGDIHQPLHCESFYGDGYPKGDKGGNEFFIMPRTAGIPLHSLWDGLLGSSANAGTQYKYAISLQNDFPRSKLAELKADPTPEKWSLESRALAVKVGYLNGKLKGSKEKADAPLLPDGYSKDAKAVAERQGALAGYRLADEITTLLAGVKAAPLAADMTKLTSEAAGGPVKIHAADAAKHYNENVIVSAKVAQVSDRGSVAFLNLDQKYPNSPLEAVIFQSNFDKFGDLHKFEGREVEITGTVTEYHGKPEIVLDGPDQIKPVN